MSQPSPLLTARQHAQTLAASGDLANAFAVLEDAIAAGRGSLGEDHPELLAAMHQLARLHQQADDPTAARRLLEEAYAAGQWRLGDADPLILEISYDLGTVAEELGNRHEARKAFARVADTGAEVLGAGHWAVARARAYLGESYAAVRADSAAPAAVPTVPRRQPASYREAEQSLPGEHPPREHREADQSLPREYRETEQSLRREHREAEQSPPNEYRTTALPVWDPPDEPTAVQHIAPAPPSRAWERSVPAAGPGWAHPRHSPAPPRTAPPRPGPPAQRRSSVIFAAIAACLAAIIAVVALVLVLASHQSNTKDNVPTVSGQPPTGVRLEDEGSDVRLTWTDPSGGRTTFLITGGRPGEVLRPMGQVGPRQTSYELHGLNADLDYCFAIVAVYSTTRLAPSAQSCTSRLGTAAPK